MISSIDSDLDEEKCLKSSMMRSQQLQSPRQKKKAKIVMA